MMKHVTIFLILVITLFSASCNKDDIASNTPACIRDEIKSNGGDDDWIIGSVDEYFFQNHLVYAFTPDGNIIADGATEIKDENCSTVCNVGGFGSPDVIMCNGEKFFQTAVLKRNIWKK